MTARSEYVASQSVFIIFYQQLYQIDNLKRPTPNQFHYFLIEQMMLGNVGKQINRILPARQFLNDLKCSLRGNIIARMVP
jgi:hypothetical protein